MLSLILIHFFCPNRPEGEKYEKAKEWKLPVVNVHWLSDLTLGHLDALKLPVQPKYLQLYPGDPFQMDMSLVLNLMGKFIG